MKRKLRRLADGAAKNQERGDGEISWIARNLGKMRNDVVENDRTGRDPDHQNTDHESEITHPCGDERFVGRFGRSVAFEPVTDQHVGSEADQFPKNEKHHEVVGQHDSEHGEHEKRQRGEVPRFPRVVAHVA